jgi:hypothetical protein
MIVMRQLHSDRSGLQRAMKGVQQTDCGIESLLLFEILSTRLEQIVNWSR